jgi:hypothetical protein
VGGPRAILGGMIPEQRPIGPGPLLAALTRAGAESVGGKTKNPGDRSIAHSGLKSSATDIILFTK